MHPDQEKWDRIYSNRPDTNPVTAEVLQHNQHLLPETGHVLDLACGLGGNSLLLAEKGLTVSCWDISPVAIRHLQQRAQAKNLGIDAKVRDVIEQPPEANSVDVLVVTHFLQRDMTELLTATLRPGGLLFYQTFCRNKVSQQGPSNPDYLLKDNELLTMFAGLKVRVYREESLLGNHSMGWRNQAMLVAEKV
ncbi:class I SAM-dependent methyltransferase [Methylophaga thiooxydans]|uniref:class I SAM-dependent methyltransferase n=1 Tax=Methylophaga thiooxydans TaxID=392484 RepID=UPI0023527809|nr:class I SAM-dependent methyltransferase [Methylophaga thiooxydans]